MSHKIEIFFLAEARGEMLKIQHQKHTEEGTVKFTRGVQGMCANEGNSAYLLLNSNCWNP